MVWVDSFQLVPVSAYTQKNLLSVSLSRVDFSIANTNQVNDNERNCSECSEVG